MTGVLVAAHDHRIIISHPFDPLTMNPSKKRVRTAEENGHHQEPREEVSPSLLSELVARISKLEESQAQVSQLQAQVVQLQERVKHLEREAIRAEDRDSNRGSGSSKTILAVKQGKSPVLADRLRRGADPNQKDEVGVTCLMHSAVAGRPECTRLLIEHGADVTHCFPAASVLYMLVRSFAYFPLSGYRQGDFVLAADLLVEADAPIDDGDGEPDAALRILHRMQVQEESKRGRERRGLINVLERSYWQKYGRCNPFLRAPPEEAAWLLLKGAADDNDGQVDLTRVRSIKPDLRSAVVDALLRLKAMRKTFVHMILTMKNAKRVSPICALRGHELTILPAIAAFAGGRGWSREKLYRVRTFLECAIQRFNVDDAIGQDDDEIDEDDDDEDDDSYEVDDDGGEESENEVDDDEELEREIDEFDEGDNDDGEESDNEVDEDEDETEIDDFDEGDY